LLFVVAFVFDVVLVLVVVLLLAFVFVLPIVMGNVIVIGPMKTVPPGPGTGCAGGAVVEPRLFTMKHSILSPGAASTVMVGPVMPSSPQTTALANTAVPVAVIVSEMVTRPVGTSGKETVWPQRMGVEPGTPVTLRANPESGVLLPEGQSFVTPRLGARTTS
jgi:hypothetical protein